MRGRNWTLRLQVALGLCAATAIASPAQTFTSLFSFNGTDGQWPIYAGSLVQGLNGNLYGTTGIGGAHGCGTAFQVTPAGALTTLHNFYSAGGCGPYGGLLLAANGSLYGTASDGGANNVGGTVFRITPAGKFKTIYSFCALDNCADGNTPEGPLIQAANGIFYGTTSGGGANGYGTVFKITPGGVLTTLYSFCSQPNCPDGGSPNAPLVQGADGNFYGTTFKGGIGGPSSDNGTIFKITPAGKLTTIYSFCSQPGCTDGANPYAGLVPGPHNTFYGTTSQGGDVGFGTIFQVTTAGTLTRLHTFCGAGCPEGGVPRATLISGTDGNFYGTAYEGGSGGYGGGTLGGTVFQLTPAGTLTALYSFCSQPNCTDGNNPSAGVVQDTDGNFYGTTYEGGANKADGTVFRLSTGLPPFVKTLPAAGAVGSKVTILGTSLTGATSVSFNGTAAAFTVVSATEITTTVPAGAATGTVVVVVPGGGTLNSNAPFTVR
jgi:uncharacterized repeat protein (TIGR03803 family)